MLFITRLTERIYEVSWWEITPASFFAVMYTSQFDESAERRKRERMMRNDKE